MNIVGGNSLRIYGRTTGDGDLHLEAVPRDLVVSSETTEQVVIADSVMEEHSEAVYDRNYDLLVTGTGDALEGGHAFESSNPLVATVTSAGAVDRVSDGDVVIFCRTRKISRGLPLTMQRVSGGTTRLWLAWQPGSLAAWLEATIAAAVADSDATHRPMYRALTLNVDGARDDANWLAASGVDLSAISLCRPNTLHLGSDFGVQASHYPASTVVYQSMAGTTYARTVLDRREIPSTDIAVVKYAPVPAAIKPALVAPADIADYVPGVATRGVLACYCDQEKKALISRVRAIAGAMVAFQEPGAAYAEFYEEVVPGDSGNNAFWPYWRDNRIVALTEWYAGGAGSGSNFAEFAAAIDASRLDMGCVGTLAIADLTGFPTYA